MWAMINESPLIKMDDAAEVVAAIKRDIIGELPKMQRTGTTDASEPKVTVNELTRVSEPPCAVA